MTERQIWLDETKYVVVDPIDYEWAKQWRWHATFNSTGRKFYATRMTRVAGKQVKVYMHKEILKRAGKRPRTVHHTIGDHDDGNSANNRRGNLFYATLKMNNNRHRQQKLIEQKEMRFADEHA
ncbi:MAG: hypothetical protein PS018_11640 [bacterium]|nr:hypothetical protein [bacterium]